MKRAISVIQLAAVKYKREDVIVVLEGNRDSRVLMDLITVALGECPWDTFHIERKKESVYECPECERHYKSLASMKAHFKKHDKEMPKDFVSTFVESNTDIRKPLTDYLKLHQKKVLIIQKRDDWEFINGIKDIRPLKYYES